MRTYLTRRVLAAVMILAAVGIFQPSVAVAESAEDEAQQRLIRGLEHYQAGDYERAIDEFVAGYELDERPELLFALAQAERLSGDCESARIYYADFIATEPPDTQRDAAQLHLDACQHALESSPVHARIEADEPLEPQRAAEPVARTRRWYDDVAGDVMLGVGALNVLISLRLCGAAGAQRELAESADDYQAYTSHRDRAMSRRNWGLATFGIGAGLIAGAAYRFVKRDQRNDRSERGLAVGPTVGGIALSFGGEF